MTQLRDNRCIAGVSFLLFNRQINKIYNSIIKSKIGKLVNYISIYMLLTIFFQFITIDIALDITICILTIEYSLKQEQCVFKVFDLW